MFFTPFLGALFNVPIFASTTELIMFLRISDMMNIVPFKGGGVDGGFDSSDYFSLRKK